MPAVTLAFWVTKVLATTLGETGGDTVTMTLDWGYLAGVALFGGALVALVVDVDAPRLDTPLPNQEASKEHDEPSRGGSSSGNRSRPGDG